MIDNFLELGSGFGLGGKRQSEVLLRACRLVTTLYEDFR
jgi:hypothetical protein